MYNYFISNKLIYEKQAGFLKGQSTVFQLIDLYHQIVQSFDSKSHTCVVFCDISKAFDRLWHKGLIFKLKQQGIRGSRLNWILNYLGNRDQRVIVAQSYSDVKHVKAGVPQGSVLGPLLFLVYVNDITQNLLSIARRFANSTTSDIDDLQCIINHDLREISKWSKQWLVTFNPDKTVALCFGNCQPPLLEFNNTVISTTLDH